MGHLLDNALSLNIYVSKADHSPGIYVYIYGEKIYVYIYFLGSFGNLASLGSLMNGKWKLHGEWTAFGSSLQCFNFVPRMLRFIFMIQLL